MRVKDAASPFEGRDVGPTTLVNGAVKSLLQRSVRGASEQAGHWKGEDHNWLFSKPGRPKLLSYEERAERARTANARARSSNVEHYRSMERERSRRARERRRLKREANDAA